MMPVPQRPVDGADRALHRKAGAIRPAMALCVALAAGGCSPSGEHPLALAASEGPAKAAPAAAPAVRTVRRTVLPAADDAASGPVAGTPTPRQIFDFHPPGSGADTWRQPFIIDPNDGPLAGEVRKSAAELRAYLAAKSHPENSLRLAAPRRCGETDVAIHAAGCVGPAPVRSLASAPSVAPDHP